jgi:hypothetical protein
MKKITSSVVLPLAAFALVLSAGGGLVAAVHADTTTASTGSTATVAAVTTATTPTTGTADAETADDTTARPRGHAPIGGDGVVSSINGTTITIAEEADEGGASYTVNASGATVTKDGVASNLSSITVGEKIFVRGTTSGTTVTATSIETGHPGHGPETGTTTP